MNSRERTLTAIYLEEPDRVPVFDYDINSPVASEVLGREAMMGFGGRFQDLTLKMLAEGKRDKLIDKMKVDRVELYKKLGLDIITARPFWGKDYTPPRRVNGHTWLMSQNNGRIWFKQRFDVDYDTMSECDSSIRQKGIQGLEEYVKFLEGEDFSVDPTSLEIVDYTVKEVGKEMLVMGDVDGTFPVGGSWLTVFLKALYVRPDLIQRLLNESTKRAVEYIKAMIDLGVEAVSGGADIAYKSGPYFSPRHFREFILPAIKSHVKACHKRGVPFIKHTDGNIEAIEKDFLIASGIDGYLAIEPKAGMDIGRLKQRYGDKVCLLGNVDCAYTLVYGTEEDVARETMECIRATSYGGGHVVCSSNSIHSFVKTENFLAMIRTARRYGRYPHNRSN